MMLYVLWDRPDADRILFIDDLHQELVLERPLIIYGDSWQHRTIPQELCHRAMCGDEQDHMKQTAVCF